MKKRTLYQLDSWIYQLLEQTVRFWQEQGQEGYLVGGALRNFFLHADCHDWDIATSGNHQALARSLANQLGGFYAPMHERASRVVTKNGQQEVVIDISPLQGQHIETDLNARDFTINAMALPLAATLSLYTQGETQDLIDPSGGRVDSESHLVRAVNDQVFHVDPLRILRAIRLAAYYNLTLETQTAHMIKRDAHLLSQVAAERIQEELYAILRPAGAIHQLRLLDETGVLTTLIPELIPARGMQQPALHHWDVFDHSLETVTTLEQLSTLLQQPPRIVQDSPLEAGGQGDLLVIQELLYESESQGIFRFSQLDDPVTRLAALLHDIGKPVTHAIDSNGNITFYHHPQAGIPLAQQIMQRLHTSTHHRRLVQQIVAHHMRPGQLSTDQVSIRASRRYFVELGPAGILVAIVSLADHLSMRGPQSLTEHWQRHRSAVRTLLTRYIRERHQLLPPRLIQADELIHKLQLSPGPIIGTLLESLAEAQADGTIQSKEEALWLAEELLRQQQ